MLNKPIFKWAGNKYRLLPILLPIIGTPKSLCEPFGGSLSLSLNVQSSHYTLNDINKDLVGVYKALMDNPERFIEDCQPLFAASGNSKRRYIELRETYNCSEDCYDRAVLFVYLNRHCFNGLTRYSKKGKFNVPFGRYNKPYFPEKEMIAFSNYFKSRPFSLLSVDFTDDSLYTNSQEGSVIFFDPPYVPASQTSNFTDYASEGFTLSQHQKLTELALSLKAKGAKVVITNSDCEVTRDLYSSSEIMSLEVPRTISAKASGRTKAKELIAVFDPSRD